MTEVHPEVQVFLDDVVAAFSDGVVEAFLIGSAASGGFDVRHSDLDVVVVVEQPLTDRPELVARLQRLQPPGRDLELVVYVRGSQPPEHELNFSGGAEQPDEPPHWFVLDGAIAEERSLALCHGRPWSDVFAPLSKTAIRAALRQSLEWSALQPADDEFARLNAIRCAHRLVHGRWISKLTAREFTRPSTRPVRGDEGSQPSA